MKNNQNPILRPYKKEHIYSCTLGAYATIEMLQARPELVHGVYIHSEYRDEGILNALCQKNNVPILYNDKLLARISQKENCYVAGVFQKYNDELERHKPHIVLAHPADMGNLGTIIRIAAGFRICNLAIITPAADLFNPKTIRASMGALFRINCKRFESIEAYRSAYSEHHLFPFMLQARTVLSVDNCPKVELFSLVFGNEAAGLDEETYGDIGTSVRIPQSDLVDSLNISVAAGIGAFMFASKNRLI